MIWRESEDDITVFYDDGTWERFTNLYEGEPGDEDGDEPPEGFYRPVRGFALVWEQQEGVRDRLGWATAPESARSVIYQAQTPVSERLLGSYWQLAGEERIYLTSHGTLAGQWEPAGSSLPGIRGLFPD
jgi:hypothetical protein